MRRNFLQVKIFACNIILQHYVTMRTPDGRHVQRCRISKKITHSADMFRRRGVLIINVASGSWHIRDSKNLRGNFVLPRVLVTSLDQETEPRRICEKWFLEILLSTAPWRLTLLIVAH